MYLIDTSVSSETGKPRPEPQVLEWLRARRQRRLYLSAITVGEHNHGIELLPESRRKTALLEWLRELLLEFDGRILPISVEVAMKWGELSARNNRAGRVIGMADTLIAATGVVHDLIVVTRNVRQFDEMGASVLNPWEPT